MMFGSLLIGPIYDRGYCRYLLAAGSILEVAGMMLTSISTKYWQLILTQGVATGIGMAIMFLPSLALLPQWFKEHRALAISLASSGTGVSAVTFPIIFNQLVPRIGFGWTVRVLSFIVLALLILANLVLRPRSAPASIRGVFDISAWKNVPFVLVAAMSLLGYLGVYIPFYYIEVYATTAVAVSPEVVAYLVPMPNVGYVVGRAVPGLIADRIRIFNTLGPFLIAAGILAICWNAVHSEAELIVFCLLFGFCSASLGSLRPATIVRVTPDIDLLGTWMGMIFVPLGIGSLTGSPIGGAIYQGHDWLGLQVFSGCAILAGAICLIWCRVWMTGWVLNAKL